MFSLNTNVNKIVQKTDLVDIRALRLRGCILHFPKTRYYVILFSTAMYAFRRTGISVHKPRDQRVFSNGIGLWPLYLNILLFHRLQTLPSTSHTERVGHRLCTHPNNANLYILNFHPLKFVARYRDH